jgi:hypothetical protein
MAIAVESTWSLDFLKVRFFDPNEGEFFVNNGVLNDVACNDFFSLVHSDYAKFKMSGFSLYRVIRK